MYIRHFGLTEVPFSIAPDPRFLFMSERHREALAHLLYGFKVDGGFVLLTGEVGTGKTTISRCLLEQVPGDCDIAFVINPKLTVRELLETVCEDLRIALPPGTRGRKALIDLINARLLEAHAQGRRTVLIVDEAQNLSNDVLEQLRLLTNLETNQRKLLQIILLGQPELRDRLAGVEMRQLAQRIVARYHLEPLSRPELDAYVQHRLAVAGGQGPLFGPRALERLYRLSGGVPRLINVICDRALLGAYAGECATVSPEVLEKAAREVLGAPSRTGNGRLQRKLVAAVLLVVLPLGVAVVALDQQRPLSEWVAAGVGWGPTGFSGPTGSVRLPAQDPATDVPVVDVSGVDAPVVDAPGGDALAWPGHVDRWLHEALAVRALFQLWGMDVPPGGIDAACVTAERRGMRCVSGTGDLATLAAFNNPAIIELRSGEGLAVFATLTRLDDRQARVALAGIPRDVPIEYLRERWSGAYTILSWAPPQLSRSLRPGASDPAVAWVERQLNRWEGRGTVGAGATVYSPEMVERVRALQAAYGLNQDGIVGPVTIDRLAAFSDNDGPRLARSAD